MAADAPPAAEVRLGRDRNFLLLWSGQTISELGTFISQVALPLVALLVVHVTTFQFGALEAAQTAPFLLLGLPAGAIVDRLRKRNVLIAADVLRMLLLGSVPIAAALDGLTLAQLYAVALVTGVCTVFFDVAYQSYLPSLVGSSGIVAGNSRLTLSSSAAQLAGPGVGGWLVGLVGAARTVAFDAASYAVSLATLLGIRHREPTPGRAHRRSLRHEIGEGLRFVLARPLLRRQAGCTGWSNLFNSGAYAIVPVYMVRVLHLSPGVIGLVFAAGAAGGLVGAAVAPRLNRWLGAGPTAVAAAWTTAAGALIAPFAVPPYGVGLLIAWSVVYGLGVTPYNIAMVSMRQTLTPPRLQGRMNASMRFIVWGTMPLGALLGGALGSGIGLRAGIAVCCVLGALAPIFVTSSVYLRQRDMPEQEPDPLDATLPPSASPSLLPGVAAVGAPEPD